LKILLADDHALFRAGMKHLLADLDTNVEISETHDGPGVLRIMGGDTAFDLLLLDLGMPGLGGLGVLAALRRQSPETPVVILSASEDPADVRAAMAGGASGFIPKSAHSEVMLDALRLVLAGGVYQPPATLLANAPAATKDEALTPRQREVLALIKRGKSNKEIGRALDLTEGTVKQHVSAILKTLNAPNRMRAVLAGKETHGERD